MYLEARASSVPRRRFTPSIEKYLFIVLLARQNEKGSVRIKRQLLKLIHGVYFQVGRKQKEKLTKFSTQSD